MKLEIINIFKNNKFLLAVLAIHFIILNYTFLPVKLMFNSEIIITEDYPYHFYQALMAKYYFSEGRTEIYDPFFISGCSSGIGECFYPTDIFINLIGFLVSFVPLIFIYKFYIYFLNLIVPLVMYFTSRNFNLKKSESILITLLAVIVWRFDWLIHQMNSSGVFSFVFASYFCIFTISIFYKYLLEKKKKCFVLGSFFCVISILIHPYSIIILVIPLIVLTILIKKINLRNILSLSSLLNLALVIIFLGSFIFTLKLINHFTVYISFFESPMFHQGEGIKTILFEFQERFVQTLILFLGVFGIFLIRKEKEIFILLLVTFVFYFTYSYFGSLIKIISYLEPERTIVPLTLFLLIPSVKSLQYFVAKIKPYKKYIVVFLVLLLLFSFFKTPDLYLKIKNEEEDAWNRRITTAIPPDVQNVISWIEVNTTPEARILLENSGWLSHFQYGGHLVSLFPYFTDREFIVAAEPYISIKDKVFPDFNEGKLFGKNITDFSETELNEYFNLFNIKWIIVWSNESKNVFDNSPEISKINQIEKFSIYETNITPNYFIKGSGNITADYGKIVVNNASIGEIIIKYSFCKELQTNPELEIRKYEIMNIYPGFVKILNENVSSFIITG